MRAVSGAKPPLSALYLFCEARPTSRKLWVKEETGIIKFFDKDGERREERYQSGLITGGGKSSYFLFWERVIEIINAYGI